jgi:hypothetical protein
MSDTCLISIVIESSIMDMHPWWFRATAGRPRRRPLTGGVISHLYSFVDSQPHLRGRQRNSMLSSIMWDIRFMAGAFYVRASHFGGILTKVVDR